MSGRQPGESNDKTAYEKDLDREAEEATEEIRRRADKEREAAKQHADEAAESVRNGIREQARRLADEILTNSGRGAARDSSPKKKTARKKVKGAGDAAKVTKKRSKSKRKPRNKKPSTQG